MSTTFAKVIDSFRTSTLGRGPGGSTLPLTGGAGAALGSLPAGRIFRVTAVLNPDTDNEQILTVLEATGLSGNTLTGITVSPGYSDANLPSGTFIDIRVCARDLSELQDAVNAVEAAVGSGAGGGITALTGDVTATGPGSAPATLKTVNANVGTFTLATIAVDAKGRITGASNGTAGSAPVSSVFGRTGAILATTTDYAGIYQPVGSYLTANQTVTLSGNVTGSGTTTITTTIATSAVTNAMLAGSIAASKLVGTDLVLTESQVTNLVSDLAAKAPLASPTFTGTPAAPTPATVDSSTTIATTAFVKAQGYATSSAVTSVFTRTGAITAQSGDYSVAQITGAAPLASPALTGAPTAPDPPYPDASTKIANTGWVSGHFLTTNQPISLFGDCEGSGTTSMTTTVVAMQGKAIATTAPTNGQVLTWLTSTSKWTPQTLISPTNAQTGTSYTLVLTDAQKMVTLSNAAAITLTIPLNSSVAFPVDTQIDLVQLGAGQVTVAASGGVTLNSVAGKVKLSSQYAGATLKQIAPDVWILLGNLA